MNNGMADRSAVGLLFEWAFDDGALEAGAMEKEGEVGHKFGSDPSWRAGWLAKWQKALAFN